MQNVSTYVWKIIFQHLNPDNQLTNVYFLLIGCMLLTYQYTSLQKCLFHIAMKILIYVTLYFIDFIID